MRSRGLLTGAASFAGHLIRNPIKTTLNTIEGIKAGPDFPDNKFVTGAMGIGGLVATFVGAVNRDPVLTGIGLTFTAAAGGIYEPVGAKIRAETHTERMAEEAAKEKAAPEMEEPAVATEETTPEPAAATGADIIIPAPKPSFKPNLPRPKGFSDGP
jgi:hypothetical protein